MQEHLAEFGMAAIPEQGFRIILHPEVSNPGRRSPGPSHRNGEFETVEYETRHDEQKRHPSFQALLEEHFGVCTNQVRQRPTKVVTP